MTGQVIKQSLFGENSLLGNLDTSSKEQSCSVEPRQTYTTTGRLPMKLERFYKHQISNTEFMKYKPVLERIKKAHDFMKSNENSPETLSLAEKRFTESVLPEARAVGIEDHFAWALLYFGKEFLDKEYANRPT